MKTANPELMEMLKNANELKHSRRRPITVKAKTQRMLKDEALEEKVINKIRKMAKAY